MVHVSCMLLVCIYTAESPDDFISTSGLLTFEVGDTVQCYDVQIVDNEFCDPGQFFTNLFYESGEPVITVAPDVAEINILDPDCGKLSFFTVYLLRF